MPGVQNRKNGYNQGTTQNTVSGMEHIEKTGKTNLNNFQICARSATGKGMLKCQQKGQKQQC